MARSAEKIIGQRLERRRAADELAALTAKLLVLALIWLLMTRGIFTAVRAAEDRPEDGIVRGDLLIAYQLDRDSRETGTEDGRIVLVIHRIRPQE